MSDNIETIKNLNGHSGCHLDLCRFENDFFVRKQSSNFEYNYRLKKQCIKQNVFTKYSKNIFAPKIFKCGYERGLFFFDMQYIVGQTLAQYSSSILITEIDNFVKLLFNNLYYDNAKINYNSPKIFKTKIEQLKILINQNKYLKEAFKILDNIDWLEVKSSPCHGDLTLENIIVTRNKDIYLIDFLDSFYNSWMIDIAKLLQDLELGWSFRNEEENATRNLRLLVAKEVLIKELKLRNQNLQLIYSILLLNVLRIYPYTYDEKTLLFLNSAIEKVLNILNTKEVVKL